MKLVVPIAQADLDTFKNNIHWYYKFLPINGIVVITKKNLFTCFNELNDITVIDEDTIIEGLSYNSVKSILSKLVPDSTNNRTGWYLQQFLKMAYSHICDDEYYLIWDSDTIPTDHIQMIDLNTKKPFFDTKTEYHKPYFDTLTTLFPNLNKSCNFSFVSEHMIIKKSIMLDLISTIENNHDLQGTHFYEKILYAINVSDLDKSGFSEFETYGTFTDTQYKNEYVFRKWNSLRRAEYFFNKSNINEKILKWCSSSYNAISFETTTSNFLSKIIIASRFYKFIPCKIFVVILKFASFLKKIVS